MGKILLLGIIALVIGSFILFLNFSRSSSTKSFQEVVIRTGKSYWPGQFWKEIAFEKGWFREAGLNVELIDTNKNYYQSLQDMVDGKMESNDFPPFDFMLYAGKGADIVGVINTDVSTGIDAIIGGQKIENINQLAGKRVAVPKGTFGEYLLNVAFERNNLSRDTVIIVDAQAEKAHELLVNGSVDAAITYEPYISESIKSVGARKLFDTSEVYGINSSVESFHRSFIESNPDLIQKYVEVWNRATEFIKENPKEAYSIIAKNNGVKVEEVEELVKGDKILDLNENRASFSYASGYDSLYGSFRRLNKFMVNNNIIDKELNEKNYFDGRFIRNLK